MGTNSPGEIATLAAIAGPDVGLITNIGPAHLEGLGSLEAIREEKGSLFEVMAGRGTAILNHDDPAIGLLAGRWRGKGITFGLGPGAEVTGRRIEPAGPEGVRFHLVIDGIGTPVFLAAAGEHNVINALAAAAASWALGFDRHEIAAGLAAFRPVPGRTEIRRLGNGAFLIIDAYNANPASVREALKTLQGLRGSGGAVVILGDMLELGERSEALHRGDRNAPCGCKHSRPLSQGIPDEGFGGRGDPAGVSGGADHVFRGPGGGCLFSSVPAEKGRLDPDQGIPKDENGSGGGEDHRGI